MTSWIFKKKEQPREELPSLIVRPLPAILESPNIKPIRCKRCTCLYQGSRNHLKPAGFNSFKMVIRCPVCNIDNEVEFVYEEPTDVDKDRVSTCTDDRPFICCHNDIKAYAGDIVRVTFYSHHVWTGAILCILDNESLHIDIGLGTLYVDMNKVQSIELIHEKEKDNDNIN